LALQRKCACGGGPTAGEECAECRKKRLRRSATGAATPAARLASGSSGRPLEADTREDMERRLGHDFGRVRIHAGSPAAEAAAAVGAQAFTAGQDIVFAAGRYAPRAREGRKLLAHELVHTVQQRAAGGRGAGVVQTFRGPGSPQDGLERRADRLAQQAIGAEGGGEGGAGLGVPRPSLAPYAGGGTGGAPAPAVRQPAPARPPIPARGTNPAGCIEPLCSRYTAPPVPTSDQEAKQRSAGFLRDALACLRGGAAASNASHSADIVQNEETELPADAQLDADLASVAGRRSRYRDWIEDLGDTCSRKQEEMRIEFHYNVVFENPAGGLLWGYHPAEWGPIEAALSALPEEATWVNPQLVRFRREECHPDDVDPQTGSCRTGFGKRVGGQADVPTGRITVYQAGLGGQPYSRSARLGIPATVQTLQHEVGHLVVAQIPRADRDHFFEDLVSWHDYAWDWITANPAPYDTWQAERDRLRRNLGFTETQLDTWLGGLQAGQPVTVGGFTYVRQQYHLGEIRTAALPAGREFEYARESREEYLAELYALAIGAPEFLHDALPADQVEWLKQVVFHTPADLDALAREAALPEPLWTRFVLGARRLFTWQQIDTLLNRLTVSSAGEGEAA
jgi:hypothetical protein